MKTLIPVSIAVVILLPLVHPSDFTETRVADRTGIYFDAIGYIQLYTAKWKLVTYVNIEPARGMLAQIKHHSRSVLQLCDSLTNKTWYSYTGCTSFRLYINSKLRQLDRLKNVIAEYTEPDTTTRQKRGVLNLVGQLSKILFGTLDADDARFYNSKISELEGDQKNFLRVAQEQLLVIKSAISTFNFTINDVNRNEKILTEGLTKLTAHVNKVSIELYDEVQALAMITEQRRQIQRLIESCQDIFQLIVDALVHAQDGTMQPEILSTEQIRKAMSNEQSATAGADFPVHLTSTELMRIITPHIYLHGKYLVYFLEIPLFRPEQFQLYRIIPFPVSQLPPRKDRKYIYVEPTREFILSDALHHKYAKLSQYQVDTCLQINDLTKVCEDTFPLLSHIPGEDCEATMLHPSTTKVPDSCSYRVMELRHTLWIKLFGNEWLHVSPQEEIFTILCGSGVPQSVTLTGRGRLLMGPGCKGYSAHTTIYAYGTITTNVTFPDILPNPSIELDCCFDQDHQKFLDKIQLPLPVSNILTHSDELKLTSHKIKEVNDLIQEEKWKMEHSQKLTYMTLASIIGVTTLVILICIFCCCCCCKCCRRLGFWLWERCSAVDCTNPLSKHCTLQQHIVSGDVHYHGSAVSLPAVVSNSRRTSSAQMTTEMEGVLEPLRQKEDSTKHSPIKPRKPLPSWR